MGEKGGASWSCVLIARNENKTLPRLLASLKEFQERGGEVVLVDTGSTDGTPEVARALGCKVTEVGAQFKRTITKEQAEAINAKFVVEGEEAVVKEGDTLFDYSGARNFAASLAANDLIAMPDCDEAYTKLDIDKINQAIAEGAEQLEYEFVFSHDQYGNPVVAFRHCKFYDRQKLRWVGIIHEVLSGSANRQYLGEDIIKLEHWQNHETDRSGYLRGLALDCYENQANDRNSHYLARELGWTARPKSALQEFKRHIAMGRWPAERAQSLIFMAEIYSRLGQEEEALAALHKSFDIEGDRRAPLIKLAEHYFAKGDYARVVTYATAALTIPQSGFYADDSAHYRQVPHELLYVAYWWLGQREMSEHHFNLAKSYLPKHPKYLHDQRFYEDLPLITIMLPQLGREESFKRACASVDNLIYPKEKIEFLIEDGEGTVPNKVAKMYAESHGEYLVFASNDIEFTPESLMIALNYSRGHDKGLVAFNTGVVLPDKGNQNEHFIIKRSLVEQIGGQIFNLRFRHIGTDNLLQAQCEKLGQFARCDDAIVHHYHFSTGKSAYDDTYKKGWEQAETDRAILKEELAKLNA